MKRICILFVLLALLNNLSNATGVNRVLRVAIFDPSLPGHNDPALQMGVRELISSCFVNQGEEYSIVERSQLDKVMAEAKFTNSDAVDESQATELGRLAGADKVVLSVISKMGTRSLISIKMINVKTASVEKQQSKLVETESLLDVIEPITLVLLGERSDVTISKPKKSNTKELPQKTRTRKKEVVSKSKKTEVAVEYDLPAQPEKFLPIELAPVLDAGVITVVCDLSEASVEGMPLNTYIYDKYADKEDPEAYFEEKFSQILNRFVSNANEKLKMVRLSQNADSKVILVIKIRHISSRGNNCVSDYVLIDSQTKEVISGIRMEVGEGVIGSFTNLLGDVFKEAGNKFGGKLNDGLKKAEKMKRR